MTAILEEGAEAGEALAQLAEESPETFAAAILAAAAEDPEAAGAALAAAAAINPEAIGAALAAAAVFNPEATGAALAAAAARDAKATGNALAAAAARNAEATGNAIAVAAARDAKATGNAIAAAALAEPVATGNAIAVAAARDPEATGNAIAQAASADAEATGSALANAAARDPVATGNAVAEAAEADPQATGNALTTSVKTNAQATSNALRSAARRNPGAAGRALALGPARDNEALADLGRHIPVEPWVPEDAPRPGEDRHGLGFWEDVGSPAPIENILGKYTRSIPQAKVNVSDLPLVLLESLPSLPEGRIANSFMNLLPEGYVEKTDFVAAHVTLFVEKSWLNANQVHEWSLQFSRFDEGQGVWRPVQAKRVREDQERVFFTVVLPGFSKWVILGTTEAPAVQFLIEDLTISANPRTNEPVTIQVQVTNLTSEEAELNLAIWVEQQIDSMVRRVFAPDEKQAVVFTLVPKNVGTTEVRVDRLLGSITVGQGPPVVPTPEAVVRVLVEPERGPGLAVGIIVGALAAIFVAGTAASIFFARFWPTIRAPEAGPDTGPEAPEGPEAEGETAEGPEGPEGETAAAESEVASVEGEGPATGGEESGAEGGGDQR